MLLGSSDDPKKPEDWKIEGTDADDGKPVDLIFAMAVPKHCTKDHSKLLSSIAERFSDPELLERLRKAADANEIWQLLSNSH